MASGTQENQNRSFFTQGDIIFKKNDVERHAYLIESGTVEIIDEDNNDQVIDVMSVGSIFGEMALLADGRRLFSARAKEQTACVIITADYMEKQIQDSPKFAQAPYKSIYYAAKNVKNKIIF